MQIKSALKTAAIAATFAYATASQAAVGIGYTSVEQGFVFDDNATMLHPVFPGVQGVEVYDLTGTSLASSILAFCIQPAVEQLQGTSYTEGAANLAALNTAQYTNRDYKTKALFETQYGTLFSSDAALNTSRRLAFQLALWDIVADDGSISSGAQSFTGAAQGDVDMTIVSSMLNGIDGYSLLNSYKYTAFTGLAGSENSQMLLSVSPAAAVPEADTWAMLVAGLGLLGVVARRKSSQRA